jgi:hypothetical protein
MWRDPGDWTLNRVGPIGLGVSVPIPTHADFGQWLFWALGYLTKHLASLGLVSKNPHTLVACVGVLGSPLTHLCLQELDSIVSDFCALHCEIASSGTRCSSCKPVVLVTLGGFHLLDGLEARSPSWRLQEDCAVLRRSDCEGYCAHPVGAAKSNSSRARHEER